MGYAGGAKDNPTYHDLGNHSETVQIDYDPTQITYEELLDVFWNNHNPTSRSFSRQYAAIVFVHDEEQRKVAEETKAREAEKRGRAIHTEITDYTRFWRAEDYHQKYRLRHVKDLWEAFNAMYPDFDDLVDSTAAARVNGYAGGHGTLEQLEDEIGRLGLSAEEQETLREMVERRLR